MRNNQPKVVPSQSDKLQKQLAIQAIIEFQDDRNPGSFFRVPGVPTPGKTTWRLVK